MVRKLFSFLGTGKYEPCYYYINTGKEQIKNKHYRCYIQECLLNLLPKIDQKPDEIVVFMTDEAKEANWLKNNNDRLNSPLPGLQDSLYKYKSEYKISPIKIPSGKSEEELWKIFDIILGEIDPYDEIIFDITHSFRSLPLVAIIILNYVKFVKKCDICGIYYGAAEVLGDTRKLGKLSIR